MSGHNKWSSIKHKKARMDAQRGRIFTKLIKEITVAARQGGGDESANPRLRAAIAAAKAANMPAANIERAIKRGTGELPGVHYEEITYEGYGPGGVAMMIEAVTDNKNRTVADLRHIFSKHGGNLAASGSVAWLFEKKGVIQVKAEGVEEDDLLLVALEAGAEDIKSDETSFEVLTPPESFEQTKKALEDAGFPVESAEITMYPKNTVKVEGKHAEQVLKLMDALDEHDDVQHVYSNFDIDVKIMEELQQG
ncbi:MAG TPA: YebC/PmpR family DNA-binding transcriptional regulator [Bacteroidetes bacterium]|nr:YebC/PmpR family DNA-binding transcriptional regulator [Bacteroidota bacterium]